MDTVKEEKKKKEKEGKESIPFHRLLMRSIDFEGRGKGREEKKKKRKRRSSRHSGGPAPAAFRARWPFQNILGKKNRPDKKRYPSTKKIEEKKEKERSVIPPLHKSIVIAKSRKEKKRKREKEARVISICLLLIAEGNRGRRGGRESRMSLLHPLAFHEGKGGGERQRKKFKCSSLRAHQKK